MTTKFQVRRRTKDAVKLLLLGHSTQAVVVRMAEKEGCSRRTARRITARALKVVHADLDKVNVANPQMASLLIHQLQEIAARGMEINQLGAAVAATRELAALLGIGLHNRRPGGSQKGW